MKVLESNHLIRLLLLLLLFFLLLLLLLLLQVRNKTIYYTVRDQILPLKLGIH